MLRGPHSLNDWLSSVPLPSVLVAYFLVSFSGTEIWSHWMNHNKIARSWHSSQEKGWGRQERRQWRELCSGWGVGWNLQRETEMDGRGRQPEDECRDGQACEWTDERMNERICEWASEWMSEWSEWMSARMMNEWTSEQMNQWVSEWRSG